jgi:hypothetical protein
MTAAAVATRHTTRRAGNPTSGQVLPCLGRRDRLVKSYRSDQFFQWVDPLSSPYFPSKQHFSFAKPLTVLGRSAARTGRGRGTRSSRALTGSTAGERRTCGVRVRRGKNECLRSDNLGFCGLVAPGASATPKGGMSSCGDGSHKRTSAQLPESPSGAGRCSTANAISRRVQPHLRMQIRLPVTSTAKAVASRRVSQPDLACLRNDVS